MTGEPWLLRFPEGHRLEPVMTHESGEHTAGTTTITEP